MGTFNIFELVLSLRRHLALMLIAAFVGGAVMFVMADSTLTYTAATNMYYTSAGAAEGLAPDGQTLNPYDITHPSLIASALNTMGSSASVEAVRSAISIYEVLDESTSAIASAMLEKGEEYVYHATEFRIAINYDGDWGYNFGKRFLHYLAEAYDEYYARKYYGRKTLVNFFDNLKEDSLDYIDLCSVIDWGLESFETAMTDMTAQDSAFRSASTGMTFTELKNEFVSLRALYYDPYYANVTQGLLTKDIEQLIMSYRNKIDDLATPLKDSESASDEAFQMLKSFYENYGTLYEQASQTQSTVTGTNTGSITLLEGYDLDSSMTTYDHLITMYVDNGVAYTGYQHDIDYYEDRIAKYSASPESSDKKNALIAKNEELYATLKAKIGAITPIARETLSDYYSSKAASDIRYLLSGSVYTNVPGRKKSVAIGALVGLVLSGGGAALYELFAAYLKRKRAPAFGEGGVLDEAAISALEGLDKAFYDQSRDGFSEFRLLYQMRAGRDGKCDLAEAFLYWRSRRQGGEVSPAEFLPIAERLGLNDALTARTLTLACERLAEWEQGGVSCSISVNCSLGQLESPSFLDTLSRALEGSSARPERLMLEVSGESEITDIKRIGALFKTLKRIGVRLAIDRFGDSVTSMRVMYDLPIDLLIISGKYLKSFEEDSIDPFLMKAVALCKERSIPACALGVETEAQAEALKRMGIDFLQGYYISRLVEPDALAERWRAEREENGKGEAK